MNDLLGWLTFTANVLTFFAATIAIGKIKNNLAYWPALSVVLLGHGMRALWASFVNFPLMGDDWVGTLRHPLPALMLQVLICGSCLWALWLINIQNRVKTRGTVDMDGNIHRLSPRQAEQKVDLAVKTAMQTRGSQMGEQHRSMMRAS